MPTKITETVPQLEPFGLENDAARIDLSCVGHEGLNNKGDDDMFSKSKLIKTVLAAFTLGAPLALSATSADAAPMNKVNIQVARYDAHDRGRGHMDMFHDRHHRPPQKMEYRPRQSHGHYRWRAGAWNWRGNQWSWAPGIWIRF